MCVNDLSRVVAWQCTGQESNPRPVDHKSSALTTTLGSHTSSSIKRQNTQLGIYDNDALKEGSLTWHLQLCFRKPWRHLAVDV